MMDLIKRQIWEKLFKRRELVHVDVVKEFYAKLTLSHFKKKDVARSKVRGVEIEFDHMRRDDEIEAPAEEFHEEEEAQNANFDWEPVIDDVVVQGESGSNDQFFDAQVDGKEPVTEAPEVSTIPASPGDSTTQ
ncbi:hypothetical protein Dimus_003167 [Dionaea muscipula]